MPSLSWPRLIDGLLLALLVVIAFLLGCYEMGDSDLWWHLRGGQWILEHGRVPGLDPFTFGSADMPWIDIHWFYEVILAVTYRVGGVGAFVLLGAAVGAAAFAVTFAAWRREWPLVAAVLCWMPALILFAFRLDPRPEIFSLFCLGCFLAVLCRTEKNPRWVWLLPPLQIFWVNVQGLFILGPILLGLLAAARAFELVLRRMRGLQALDGPERNWWRHVGAASLATAAACLVNPYFLDGARFPFDLFPKVSQANNIYKQYIDELQSPLDFVQGATYSIAGKNWFFLSLYFLLLLAPVSFLCPVLWRSWSTGMGVNKGRKGPAPTTDLEIVPWLSGLAAVAGLLGISTLTISGIGTRGWIQLIGDNITLILIIAGAGMAFLLRKRSGEASIFAVSASVALAVWIVAVQQECLGAGRGLLLGGTDPSLRAKWPLVITGAIACGLVLRWEGNLFRMLLLAAFAYLSLQALQNWTRFALVAGAVSAWNFGEWLGRLKAHSASLRSPLLAGQKSGITSAKPLAPTALPQRERGIIIATWILRAGAAAVLCFWIAALASDRYYAWTGEVRHFAFREEPLQFAHDAAIFAGQAGLPDRALVYGLAQTGVYDFHNAPRCKPFMDGRLEMPDQKTFETYINVENWLRRWDVRWEQAVAEMGNPLLLLDHQLNFNSEALLLCHPRWRCIYYDALASIFVHQDHKVSATAFATVDFAARHFYCPKQPSIPSDRGAAAREQSALFSLAGSLPPRSKADAHWRTPLLLAALNRAELALTEDPTRSDVWVVLGNCYYSLVPDRTVAPPTPAEAWRLERGVYFAQATYCFQRALAYQANSGRAWRSLFNVYRVREMLDSQLTAADQWLLFDPKVPAEQRKFIANLRAHLKSVPTPTVPSASQLPSLATILLRNRLPETTQRLVEVVEQREPITWNWDFADQIAGLYMHLGRSEDARRVWQQAEQCPSEAVRACRVACTYWIERDFETALRLFRECQSKDSQLADASWGLAFLHTQRGDAGEALTACRQGLKLSLNQQQRSDLEALQKFLAPYASSGSQGAERVSTAKKN